MGAPSVTWTFTNGTTSDATQVNTNFTDLINDMSDGTTDFSIGSIVVAGNTTLNGNVTLGNSTADDITITGNIAAHITFKNNATYNIGSSTVGALSLYLGNNTRTVRIMAGTIGSSWTLTLPNDVPTITGQTFVFNTSGTAEFRYPDKFTGSKTTDYTATGDETVIPCAPAANMTVTLPAAGTMTGKSLTIVKTDSDATKTVTVDANSSETINGVTTYVLSQQYETLTIKCDGSQWIITDHRCVLDVELYLDTGNGHGSTNTMIRRFTNSRRNTLGNYATYADSSTNGGSVTISAPGAGLWRFSFSDSRAGGGFNIGFSLNGSALTTAIQTVTYAQGKRAYATGTTATPAQVSLIIRLVSGDIIRAHTDGNTSLSDSNCIFHAVKIGD